MELKNKCNIMLKQIENQIELNNKIENLIKENTELKNMLEKQNIQLTEIKEENKILKEEIKEVREENKILKEEIKEVREENKIIKEENKIIKEENKELKSLIKQQGCEIVELKKENIELKKTIVKLEDRLDVMETKQLFNKYVVAIQDLNSLEHLEPKIGSSLKNLKRNRIATCHYLDNTYSTTEIDERRTILYDKLVNMPVEIQNMFNAQYPNLINDIMPCVINIKTIPSPQDMTYINNWWSY
jgi:chromosome segregation ATPase